MQFSRLGAELDEHVYKLYKCRFVYGIYSS